MHANCLIYYPKIRVLWFVCLLSSSTLLAYPGKETMGDSRLPFEASHLSLCFAGTPCYLTTCHISNMVLPFLHQNLRTGMCRKLPFPDCQPFSYQHSARWVLVSSQSSVSCWGDPRESGAVSLISFWLTTSCKMMFVSEMCQFMYNCGEIMYDLKEDTSSHNRIMKEIWGDLNSFVTVLIFGIIV